jgi:hypothetical protein
MSRSVQHLSSNEMKVAYFTRFSPGVVIKNKKLQYMRCSFINSLDIIQFFYEKERESKIKYEPLNKTLL